jgi:hypothetical protein
MGYPSDLQIELASGARRATLFVSIFERKELKEAT